MISTLTSTHSWGAAFLGGAIELTKEEEENEEEEAEAEEEEGGGGGGGGDEPEVKDAGQKAKAALKAGSKPVKKVLPLP